MKAVSVTAPRSGWVMVAAVAGLGALAIRPVAWSAVAVTSAIGVAGAVAPVSRSERARWGAWTAVVAIGAAAVLVARGGSQMIPPAATGIQIAAGLGAAVAEELFFRRFLYGWLLRWGAAAAVITSAVAFALVHVPAYGVAALPVDLAAGLLFGWQRWATGGWTAPAATHVIANLSMLL